ncbi:hypothetical protein ABW20_dc0108790 [Dactylellina cionopaga]|nr:hypothetical protein ABW20_dc0108790 [Dactylellina cionopaga]
MPSRLDKAEYNVGWLCALPLELAAANLMIDEHHDAPWNLTDPQNHYIFGSIGRHNVVATVLPEGSYGTISASDVVKNFKYDFPDLQYRFMVGIAGGAPTEENDIRLGDVVVSVPSGTSPGVIQWDFRKTLGGGESIRIGVLAKPPQNMLQAVSLIHAVQPDELSESILNILELACKDRSGREFKAPPAGAHDWLFRSEYEHYQPDPRKKSRDCPGHCDTYECVPREERRPYPQVRVHFGTIASGNNLMRDGIARDQVQQETDALCFEMEASGVMDAWPCLVVRGICDYADSHKNKLWQKYSAGTAAAFTKSMLLKIVGPYGGRCPYLSSSGAGVEEYATGTSMLSGSPPRDATLAWARKRHHSNLDAQMQRYNINGDLESHRYNGDSESRPQRYKTESRDSSNTRPIEISSRTYIETVSLGYDGNSSLNSRRHRNNGQLHRSPPSSAPSTVMHEQSSPPRLLTRNSYLENNSRRPRRYTDEPVPRPHTRRTEYPDDYDDDYDEEEDDEDEEYLSPRPQSSGGAGGKSPRLRRQKSRQKSPYDHPPMRQEHGAVVNIYGRVNTSGGKVFSGAQTFHAQGDLNF